MTWTFEATDRIRGDHAYPLVVRKDLLDLITQGFARSAGVDNLRGKMIFQVENGIAKRTKVAHVDGRPYSVSVWLGDV